MHSILTSFSSSSAKKTSPRNLRAPERIAAAHDWRLIRDRRRGNYRTITNLVWLVRRICMASRISKKRERYKQELSSQPWHCRRLRRNSVRYSEEPASALPGGNQTRQGSGRHPCDGRVRALNQTSPAAE